MVPIRSTYPIKRPILALKPQSLPDALIGVLEISKLKDELKKTIDTLHSKILEAEKRIAEADKELERTREIQKGEPGEKGDAGKNADEEKIAQAVHRAVMAQIKLPENGKDADEGKIIEKVLSNFPKEEALIRKILRQIKIPEPQRGKDGKDADEEKIVEKVLGHFEKGKIKLKAEHIDGYQNAESVMRNFAARGYLHGGGDTVKAGSGISLTKNSDGTTTITASGVTAETPTGAVNGVNTIFTVLHVPQYIVVDGLMKFTSTGQFSYLAGTVTILDGAPPVQYIISFY